MILRHWGLRRSGLTTGLALLLSACSGGMIPPGSVGPGPVRPTGPSGENAARPVPATPRAPLPATPAPAGQPADIANALTAGLTAGPAIETLIPDGERARAALAAFRLSCPTLMRRTDQS